MNISQPLLSVCIITYNQEQYIAQTLDSVLSQKTKFNFEIIIGEDKSDDRTRDICEKYSNEHPNIITLLSSEKNHGIQKNFERAMQACNGKYIAICEGDDYWTDDTKLQDQLDFLEKNDKFSACCHQSMVLYEDGLSTSHPFNDLDKEMDFNTLDLIGLRKFHTASVVFRSEILRSPPYLPTDITATDRALFLLLAAYGPVRFLPFIGCVYRKNNEGISSWVKPKMLKKDLNIIPWIKQHNAAFPKRRYKAYIHKTIWQYPKHVSRLMLLKHYMLFVWYSFSYFPGNLGEIKSSLRLKRV